MGKPTATSFGLKGYSAYERRMQLSDEKLIEFFWKSSLKSFPAMLDALRYLDGNWVQEEAKYEIFYDTTGDNPPETIQIRVPQIRGIPADALLAFVIHAQAFNLIRRREKMAAQLGTHEEIVVFYGLTPSGSYVVKVLEILTDISAERIR